MSDYFTGTIVPKFGTTWFVDCRLTEAQLQAFDAWIASEDAVLDDLLNEAFSQRLIPRVTFDATHETCVATLTCAHSISPNHGAIITARSNEPLEAMYMVLFKLSVLPTTGPWPSEEQAGRRG